MKSLLLLDNIRSVHNTGSIFRTAETIGILKIYCVGTTPTPKDRFNRKRKDFIKVSLGAEDLVDWEYAGDSVGLVKDLKKQGYKIISLELNKKAVNYKTVKAGNKSVIIIGNEVEGISKELLKLSDVIAQIPMKGGKESLNVSVATGVFLFRLFG